MGPAVTAGIERGDGVVVAAEELRDADECFVGQRPGGIGRNCRLARNERQDLPAMVVDAEMAWRGLESDALQVIEQRLGRDAGGSQRAPHGVADARDQAGVGGAAVERYLLLPVDLAGSHGSASSSRASEPWVTRLVTNPPRTAALTARALAVP